MPRLSTLPVASTLASADRFLIHQASSGVDKIVTADSVAAFAVPTSVIPVSQGGTGQTSYTDGQILVGNTTSGGLNKTTITAGSNITVTNGPGTISISSSGGGSGTGLPTSGPLYSRIMKNISGTITSSSDVKWASADVFNVKDYGAVGSDPSTTVGAQGFLLATQLITGNHYVVKNTGGASTDFTLLGSSSNTPGTEFIYNGIAATGTGQAYVDDSFAFQAAINAACSRKVGAVYVPAGLWGVRNINVPSTGNPAISIIGDGPDHSRLQNFLVGNNTYPILSWFPGMTSPNDGGFIEGISFRNYGNRSVNNPLLVFTYATSMVMNNVGIFGMYDCVKCSHSNLVGNNVFIASGSPDNNYSGCCLRMIDSAATLVNTSIYATSLLGDAAPGGAVGTNLALSPPLWLSGTATGHSFTNVSVTGAGTKYSKTPTSVILASNLCVVSGLTDHTFMVNDYIVITGMTPSYLNGYFRIVYKSASSVTFTNVNADVSASTIGLATSVPCAVLVDNSIGAQNESSWTGGLIQAAGYPLAPLSVGIYLDGRAQGTASSGHAISGWTISDTYIDLGRVGVLITGGGNNGISLTTNRINISNVIFSGNAGDSTSSALGAVWVEQTPGVSINGIVGFGSVVDATAKAIYAYADSDPTHVACNGLSIRGSVVGAPASYNYTSSPNTVCKYGVYLDGAIKGLSITGNTISGFTSPILNANSAVSNSTVMNSSGNLFITASANPVAADVIPVVTAASTITLPFNDVVKIDGSTTINIINGGWIGREVKLLLNNGPTFTGGNMYVPVTPVAGASLTLICDGSYWWPEY